MLGCCVGSCSPFLISTNYSLIRTNFRLTFREFCHRLFSPGLVLSTLIYFRYIITKAESVNFMDLLWRVFITGLITTVGSLLIRLFFYVFGNSGISENPVTINFFYHILVGLVVIFMVSTFVVWKRLILYQKTKNLIQIWSFFEYALLASLAFDLLGNKFLSINFNIAFIFLGGFALVLSFNLKWDRLPEFPSKVEKHPFYPSIGDLCLSFSPEPDQLFGHRFTGYRPAGQSIYRLTFCLYYSLLDDSPCW